MKNPYARALKLALLFPGRSGLRANRRLAEIQLGQHEAEVAGGAVSFWTSPLVPAELLNALGIHSTTPETLGAVLASVGMGRELVGVADAVLHATGTCTFQRCALGALERGYVPAPRAFASASALCDDTPQLCSFLSRRRGLPYFLIDVPDEDDADALVYVTSQLEEFVGFCEEAVGRRLTPDALSAALRRSNEARAQWLRANRLRQRRPAVIRGLGALRMAGGMILQKFGLPEGTEVLRDLADEVEERQAAGSAVGQHRRLLWLHLFPLFDRGFMEYVEDTLGAVVAFEESSQVWWDELDEMRPLESLARKILSCPLAGGGERRAAAALRMAREYRVDGVVHFSHLGCKALSGGVSLLRDRLRAEGFPFLELSADCNDSAGYSFAPLRTRLDAFLELLG